MKQIKGFKKCNILFNNEIIKTNIYIKDGIIEKIGQFQNDDLLELNENLLVVPGFIDQHIHGANGYDFMDKKGYDEILKDVAKSGVTSVCATTTTHSIEELIKTLTCLKNYMDENNTEASKIIGIHLEGPFISHQYKGAQLEEYIINSDINIMDRLINSSFDNILIVTLDGKNTDFIKFLKEKNITVSIGHSNATYNQCILAVNKGLSCVTHTFNGMSKVHHRDLGVVGAALLNDELFTEIICDGIHVSLEAIRLLVKNKPLNKIILITDSLKQKGLPDGIYEEVDQTIILKNNSCYLEDGTLAGSVLSMNQAIKNIINFTNVSLIDAINFATINPAINLKLDHMIGSIQEGKLADFAIIDNELNVYMTIKEGKIIYQKGELND